VGIVLLSILVQIACAVHCVRNNRNSLWLMVIIFLSVPGCIAYAIFEILPAVGQRREVRAARAAAVKKLDPDRELRAAREALETAETAANCTRLGDVLAEKGEWREAAFHYRAALDRTVGEDRAGKVRLARALLESGEAQEARRIVEALPPSASEAENDRAGIILARALDELGDSRGALNLYSDLGARLPGAEAQCRQAALLISQGREREALPLLEEAERRARRLDQAERRRDADMYDWAARTLTQLRTS
jgi:hypothetical protein